MNKKTYIPSTHLTYNMSFKLLHNHQIIIRHIFSSLNCIQRHYSCWVKSWKCLSCILLTCILCQREAVQRIHVQGVMGPCDGSLRMFWAFLRYLALYSSSREGSEQPMIFLAVVMTLWSVFLCVVVQPTYHTHMQYVNTLSI